MLEDKIITYCRQMLEESSEDLPFHNIDLIKRRSLFLNKLMLKSKELESLESAIWIDITAMAINPLYHHKEVQTILSNLGDVISEDLKNIFKLHLKSTGNSLLSRFNRVFNYSYEAKYNINQLRKEQIQILGDSFLDNKWMEEQGEELALLEVSYFEFDQGEVQEQAIAKETIIKKKEKYQKAIEVAVAKELHLDSEDIKKLKKKLTKVEAIPERGIESWFRLTSKNLYTRLSIVDTKAGMLITANSLIISIVLGSLYTRLDEDPHLIFAVASLIITNVTSITFAILAAIPKGEMKNKTTESANSNLMTFEDFYNLSLGEYRINVKEIMNSGDVLYNSITTNIYELGQKLARKYRLIRLSFLVLLYGFLISIMMFGVCHLIGL